MAMIMSEVRLPLYRIFDNTNSSSNGSCPPRVQWCTNDAYGYQICMFSPTILPTCILALIIGMITSDSLAKVPGKFPSRWFYTLTFFLYGIMMTFAGILHCFIGDEQSTTALIPLIVAVMDVGLTSNIAISFLFCGLCDVGLFNAKAKATRYLLFICYIIIFTLWTLGILNQWSWTFHVLYLNVIVVCCGIYLFTQLCLKSARRALPLMFVGGLYGSFGLAATYFADKVCASEGPFWSQYIGPEFIWFLFSDISVAFIYLYVKRANEQQISPKKNSFVDREKFPMKY